MLSYVLNFIVWSKKIYSPLRIDNSYAYMQYESQDKFRKQDSRREEYDKLL